MLMESLLFGTNRGAFTGAIDKAGLFEEANGGTLLLDEINSLSPALQAKLLRAIQENNTKSRRHTRKEIDVRIIATINEDLLKLLHTIDYGRLILPIKRRYFMPPAVTRTKRRYSRSCSALYRKVQHSI